MNINLLLSSLPFFSQKTIKVDDCVIGAALDTGKPLMVARFGSVEIKGVLYPRLPWPIQSLVRNKVFTDMANNAGFFSVTEEKLTKFSHLMIEDMGLVDILGCWRFEERFLRKYLIAAKKIDLIAIEPYFSTRPWTEFLIGRKVLVVHPFSTTIENQYAENRTKLFQDQRVLPEFKSLQTVKAVQTIAGNESEFRDWFAALESMKNSIAEKDFDVAIIGCGAYGFPLAAHVKRLGKQAVHLGGATQILFGIRGRRWDADPIISSFYNDSWTRPLASDIPQNSQKVEGGCYW